jgi:O-antigen/teichoic acid export membrane protein
LRERERHLSEPGRQTRRIAAGTVARLAGRVLGALVSLFALREATRYFGPVEWGPITAALAWFTVFSFLGGPGVATLTMREIARPESDADSVFGRALGATLVVSVVAAIASVAIGVPVYWGREPTLEMVLILAAGTPLMGLFLASGAVLVGRGRSGARSLLDLESSVLLLAATLLVVGGHLRSLGYAQAYLVSVVASGVVAFAIAAHFVRPKFRGMRQQLRSTLRRSLPLGQFDFFAVIYTRADSVMLFFIKGDRPVALYGVAFQIATFLFAMPALLSNALLPDFMRADPERRNFLARRALDVILTVALPLPIFGAIFARPFVVWLAGDRFSAAGPLLAILMAAGAIALMNGYLFQMAVFAGAEKGLWRAIAIATVGNLAANAVAVTLFGAIGAAYVMIFSEALGFVIYWRIYRARMPNPLGRRYPLSVVAASAALLAIWWGLHRGLGLEPGAGFAMLPRALLLAAAYALALRSISLVVRLAVHGRRDVAAGR